MSTTPHFKYIRPFPFCPEDISGIVPGADDYVDNLTLAQAMAFFWSLETFTLTFSGSVSCNGETKNVSGNVTLSPASSTLFTRLATNDSAMMEGFGDTALASCPPVREPRARVCTPGSAFPWLILDAFWDAGPGSFIDSGSVRFSLGTDPVNAGKYRIYYRLFFEFWSAPSAFANLNWVNGTGGDVANGTITIGGLTFNWACTKGGVGGTPIATGGTLSATSGNFTYV